MFNCIHELIDFADEFEDESTNYECNITLKVDGETFKAYSVDVSPCELSFNCGNAVIEYDVNSNGMINWVELFSIERIG